MTGMDLADYKAEHEIPADERIKGTDYSGIFLDSLQINADFQEGQGFLAPQNLLSLSEAALDELQVEMAGVYDDIDASVEFFEHVHSQNNGVYTHQYPTRNDNRQISESLVVGTVKGMKVTRNDPTPDAYAAAVDEVSEGFKAGTAEVLQQVIDVKPEFDRISAAVFEGGMDALTTNRDAIIAMPEFAEQQLLADMREALADHAHEANVAQFLNDLEGIVNETEPESEAAVHSPGFTPQIMPT